MSSFPYPTAVSRDDFAPTEEEFNADAFLYTHHRYASLDSLLKDLKRLSDSLNDELLNLVNVNYAEFIRLGKSIDGGLDVVNSIQVEVKRFSKQLHATNANLTSCSQTVKDLIGARKRLLSLKTSIKLCSVLNDHVTNFQTLLNLDMDTANDESLLQHLKNLTSLYLSFSHLFGVVSETHGDVVFVNKILRDKIMSCKFEFNAYLDEVSQNKLRDRTKSSEIILELLNIYKITGRESSMTKLAKR
ncbi:hypothetical protein PGUG_05441 [Meyerozyma guilliermondii ATCC 6260]|uniref:Conserved oligomeric Golgi complex subunit 2 n=1 Tax=Meyerozyma guilliermondii (strain ATCC 6260 / CBS 566 / DSM 6381 / JCM 1539 / NBRC 10279 / NRRL Y-324) TaxID=294746 RepID=A5DQ90_PICGU|nr:uncharacterized protein PGUG_05441 [Meyerozyma guilliermondii ATCC 6260]EDK41343.2 hypothetical protein PGUG_05441 [Meyerozyma guilliermondii ATCC 6260]